MSDDYISNPGKNTQIKKRYEARNCTPEEFGSKPWEKAFYDSWDGFSIICPDIPEGEHFKLEGDNNKMHGQYYEFTMDRCTDDPEKPNKPKCKKPEEINNFIETFQIQAWQIYYKIDFSKMTDHPTFKVMEIISQQYLKKDMITAQKLFMGKQYFKLKDSLL